VQARLAINFGHGSSPGRVRESNEDYHRVKVFQTPRGPLAFLAVADGMGGAAAGERASKLAIETVTDGIQQYVAFLSQGGSAVPLEKALEKSILKANREIHRAALEHPEWDGMGTTLTVVLIHGKEYVLGHVGDSRAYLVRGGQVRQITKDHSWVAEQVEKGIIAPEAAEHHQFRNLLSRALGTRPKVEPDVSVMPLSPGDTFILASDGLHGLVQEAELLEELRRARSLQMAVDYWIDLANKRGGPDNITGVVAQVGP
jgi:protein phosphatase